MAIKKHVGKIRTTDQRCVVVFMQIPGDDASSLIVESDSLPDMVHDAFFRIVDSVDANNTVNLGELLSRRPSPEPGMDMLTYLHTCGRLRKVPVDNVMMYPYPNNPFPLSQIIELNGGQISGKKAPAAEANEEKFNPHLDRKRLENTQSMLDLATNKLREAELLEDEARKKREEAYAYFPQLRPGYNANITATSTQEIAELAPPAYDAPDISEFKEYVDEEPTYGQEAPLPISEAIKDTEVKSVRKPKATSKK